MNHMKEVAKILGVELGEEFKIEFEPPTPSYYNITAKITEENGLDIVYSNVCSIGTYWEEFILCELLCGELNIKHKPSKPAYRDYYWSIKPNGEAHIASWLNEWIDLYHYKIGNCYNTQEDAEANRDKWVAFYNSDEVLEVLL